MSAAILLTGATGLVGARVLRLLLDGSATARPSRIYVLVRDAGSWRAAARAHGCDDGRVLPVVGDLTRPGLGLAAADRRRLVGALGAVLHVAADTCFSRPLAAARATNVEGTRRVVELALEAGAPRFTHVSTAFVAGRMTGAVPEAALAEVPGWVNAYERSKHEAEAVVRASGLPWSVLRSSTIACDTPGGAVSQLNAVHKAARLHHAGLASLLPGHADATVDLVPADYVAEAVVELGLSEDTVGATLHLCAGVGALPLAELLELTHATWSEDPAWRRREIARPAITDLATYRLFEETVVDTGDARLRRVTRSLAHFVPQLALPKRFATARTDAALGRAAPPVRSYWRQLLQQLRERWPAGSPLTAA